MQRWRGRWAVVSGAMSLLVAGAAEAGSSCMYGPDGTVMFRPEGAECRDVATAMYRDEASFKTPSEIPGGAWLDVQPGDEQLFVVEIKHGRSVDGDPFKYTTYAGVQHREVIAGPARLGANSMERRLTLRAAEASHDLDRTDLQRDFIRATPQGYELVSINRNWFYGRQDVDYGSGSLLLPAVPVPGKTWTSAKVRDELVKIDETGEVMGRESVTIPAGTFEDCLRVRYTGEIGSRVARLDGRSNALGRYVRDVWFARGIGVIREHEEGRFEAMQRDRKFSFSLNSEASIKGVKPRAVPAKQR